MILLAIDPGPHCGYAQCTFQDQKLTLLTCGTYQLDELEMAWTFFLNHVQHSDVVILEDFRTVRQLSKEGLFTIEVLGVLIAQAQLYCKKRLDEPVVLQLPSVKKPFAKQAVKLAPGYKAHAQDALAHILAYLHQRKLVPPNWQP